MYATKTLTTAATAALAATIALTSQVVDAGLLTLFEDIYHRGSFIQFDIWKTDQCHNLGCYNDRTSSAEWSRLLPGFSLVFYTGFNCQGDYRSWPTDVANQPSNFVVDGINDQVSSVMLTRSVGSAPSGYNWDCSERGVAGNNASETATVIASGSGTSSGSGTGNATQAPTALAVEGH